MFYQQQPKRDVYFRKVKTGHNQIKTHLHGFYELHCCVEGVLRVCIEGRMHVLNPGEAALIFPYQPHYYEIGGGKGCFFTFESRLIAAFAGRYSQLLPEDGVFPFTYAFDTVTEDSDEYAIKSFLYAMCSAAAKMRYVSVPVGERELLGKIFSLTEKHYNDCNFSLGTLAEMLGYDYGYISKYFLKLTGMKYSRYLNQRRIDCAVELLQNSGADNISDVALACGYGNIRSFNRNFKKIKELTPQEYRTQMGR